MDRFKSLRRVHVHSQETLEEPASESNGDDALQTLEKGAEREVQGGGGGGEGKDGSGDLQPFMGMKIRRRASIFRECSNGDYIGVDSDPYLTKILSKQGDKSVLFADRVLKFTGSGKMKRRILLITDFAIYLVDPDADALKRRVALAAVDRLCMSELSDNFFAIIIPTEYDLLMASTRKKEIVSALVEATSRQVEVESSNSLADSKKVLGSTVNDVYFLLARTTFCVKKGGYLPSGFEYNASADMVKEVQFEEADGGIKTRISKKESESESQ